MREHASTEMASGVSSLHISMQFREKFACARALVRACMEIDERDEKKRELRSRNVRVQLGLDTYF